MVIKPGSAQPREQWRDARAEYLSRIAHWVTPRLERRSRGLRHPVDDFLWEYYPISPGKLRAWHPGCVIEGYESDLALVPADDYVHAAGTIRLRSDWAQQNQHSIKQARAILTVTASRPARSGCFGLHEWAMVLDAHEVRHSQYPLRVSQHQIRSTIDEVGLRCTHFDAFRFFTAEAAPLNPLQLTRELQLANEQPGCLHANMDLYKHAVRLAPLVGSHIVLEAFELARDIREVDMRAAPYDLSSLDVAPLRVETPEGRADFARLQQSFATRAAVIRARILERTEAAVTIG